MAKKTKPVRRVIFWTGFVNGLLLGVGSMMALVGILLSQHLAPLQGADMFIIAVIANFVVLGAVILYSACCMSDPPEPRQKVVYVKVEKPVIHLVEVPTHPPPDVPLATLPDELQLTQPQPEVVDHLNEFLRYKKLMLEAERDGKDKGERYDGLDEWAQYHYKNLDRCERHRADVEAGELWKNLD